MTSLRYPGRPCNVDDEFSYRCSGRPAGELYGLTASRALGRGWLTVAKIGIDPNVAKARSAVGVASRSKDPNKRRAADAELAVAKIEDYVRRTVSAAPPLTAAQRDRLALLLRGDA